VDKKIAAERIRARLEKRLANFLGCEVGDLPRLKLGELVHLAFAIWGEEDVLVQSEMEKRRFPLVKNPPLRGGDFQGMGIYRPMAVS
jgi:hypothetical protein